MSFFPTGYGPTSGRFTGSIESGILTESHPGSAVLARLKDTVWRTAFARWPPLHDTREGYTLLLPVPADLPVFLRLALANAAAQDCDGRVETLVIPDVPSAAFT